MNTASNHYIYARWTANTYIVTFNRTEFKNGEVVYFNPNTAQVCDASDAVSTTGTKDGCMKWYAFLDDGGSTIKLLLDHNTTAKVAWNSSSGTTPDTALAQLNSDVTNWSNDIKSSAKLISANEVNQIAPTNLNWNVNDYTTFYFLHTGKQELMELVQGQNTYAWLFDNMGEGLNELTCINYGCNAFQNNITGYWTSTKTSYEKAWGIGYNGVLSYDGIINGMNTGIRPVIEISKSLLSTTKTVIYDNLYGELPSIESQNHKLLGWYTSTGTIITKDTKVNILSNINVYSKLGLKDGEEIYFNPVTNVTCLPSEVVSTTGTKSGCMKWYAFLDDGGSKVKLLLDHNTTAGVAWNSDSTGTTPVTANAKLIEDISGWNTNIKNTARLISATEVNQIAPTYPSWKINNYLTFYNMHRGEQIVYEGPKGSNKYAWLMDNTYNCETYGCNIASNDTWGYWTSDFASENRSWLIAFNGGFNYLEVEHSTTIGIRPVIEVNRNIFE